MENPELIEELGEKPKKPKETEEPKKDEVLTPLELNNKNVQSLKDNGIKFRMSEFLKCEKILSRCQHKDTTEINGQVVCYDCGEHIGQVFENSSSNIQGFGPSKKLK